MLISMTMLTTTMLVLDVDVVVEVGAAGNDKGGDDGAANGGDGDGDGDADSDGGDGRGGGSGGAGSRSGAAGGANISAGLKALIPNTEFRKSKAPSTINLKPAIAKCVLPLV